LIVQILLRKYNISYDSLLGGYKLEKPRYEYKQKAASLLEGKYTNVIIILLIMGIISSLGTGYSAGDIAVGGGARSSWANVISLLLGAAFAYGSITMYMGIVANKEPSIEEVLLVGFKDNYVRNLVCQLLTTIFVVLWSLLLIIPGIVKAYAYSMNFYLLKRDPNLSGQDAITKSKEFTMGYKMDLFMLDLSYLGWYFIGIFTLGILWLWIVPKHLTARVLYYDEIYAKRVPVPVEKIEVVE